MLLCFFFFYGTGDHRDLHVLTHSFPTRRSSDLSEWSAFCRRSVSIITTGLGAMTSISPKFRMAAVLATAAFAVLPMTTQAATYPTRPINLIVPFGPGSVTDLLARITAKALRSEEHTSELQSLMRQSSAVFCL